MAPLRSTLGKSLGRLLKVGRTEDLAGTGAQGGAALGTQLDSKFFGGKTAKDTQEFTVDAYDTAGSPTGSTTYASRQAGDTLTLDTAGYYVLTVAPNSVDLEFDMWAWGGAGGGAPAPAPPLGRCHGGCSVGVRGRKTLSKGDVVTICVGAGGGVMSSPGGKPGQATPGAWPNGGDGGGGGDGNAQGGGASKILPGTVPYADATTTPSPQTAYLVGGAGGGGAQWQSLSPTDWGMQGGYPSGFNGNPYPADSPDGMGKGGTQSAGGEGGVAGRGPVGGDGAKYAGGDGNVPEGGAGGGDGYYGGGAGGGLFCSGGGGSGYINPTLSNTAGFEQPSRTADSDPGSAWAVDDPANPGIKPASAGNAIHPPTSVDGQAGVVVFKIISTG